MQHPEFSCPMEATLSLIGGKDKTLLSWGLYGTRCWEYLLGEKAVKPYQIIFTLVVIISATMDLSGVPRPCGKV